MKRMLCSMLALTLLFGVTWSSSWATPRQEVSEYGNDRGELWSGSSGDDDLPSKTAVTDQTPQQLPVPETVERKDDSWLSHFIIRFLGVFFSPPAASDGQNRHNVES